MKRYLNLLPDWLIMIVISMFFLVTWPFLLIVGLYSSIFSKDMPDSEKVRIAKEILLVIVLVVVIVVVYSINGFDWQP